MEILKNLPLALFGSLSPAELSRYDKQLLLEDWGLSAQEKIKNSRVFVAGAGGLMSTAAFNLAAAGVGHLRVVDSQRVSLKDLGDQMLYRDRDLNKPKVAVLQQRLQEANPFLEIEFLERKINDQNIVKMAQGSDLFLVDLNELQTAAVLNRAAVKLKIALVVGWIRELRGFITTLNPSRGICLDCTSLEERTGDAPGMLAPMSGITGGMMALEALHILGGAGPVFLERLFGYDGELGHCLEETVRKKSLCQLCRGK